MTSIRPMQSCQRHSNPPLVPAAYMQWVQSGKVLVQGDPRTIVGRNRAEHGGRLPDAREINKQGSPFTGTVVNITRQSAEISIDGQPPNDDETPFTARAGAQREPEHQEMRLGARQGQSVLLHDARTER